MKQLALDLQLPEPFSFDDFLIGPNLEAFLALKALADGASGEPGIHLWGAIGAGKRHLLHAVVLRCQQAGRDARYWDAAREPLQETAHGHDLLAVDHVDRLDDASQIALFGLINAQREAGRAIVTASHLPPARLALREDLTTRLGWGLVFEIGQPDDDDKSLLLRHRARQRGYEIDEVVCRWLLTHISRDIGRLTTLLDELDRAALAAARPLSLPFVRGHLHGGDQSTFNA